MSGLVKIITDSACDLPQATLDKLGIAVVPLSVRFGDDEFVDRVQLSNEDFWKRMANSKELPSTAAPSPGAFEEAFRSALAEGHGGVVCVNISSKLSATYQTAATAAGFVQDAIPVQVFDSMNVTVGHGILVLEAARLASEGQSAEEIVTALEALRPRLRLFGAFNTLENLQKGGRIGKASALVGSLLSVKPVLKLEEGELLPESRQRTWKRALEYLAGLVSERAPVSHVMIAHSGAEGLDSFIEALSSVAKPDEITVCEIGPVIGSHGGPGLLAVAFATS